MKKPLGGLCLVFVGVFLSCTYSGRDVRKEAQEEAASRNQRLVIGRVSDNPKKHYKRLKPMVDYVAGQSKDLGITEGSVLMARSNQELIQYLKEGKVDWVTETPFSAIIFSEKGGAEVMLRKWKKGVPEYHCVFIARKDSDVNSLSDLNNKKIAFEDRGSTTAYFVPIAVLKDEGLDLVELSSPREKAPAGKVGYAFAGGELNITTWVHKGLTDAGAYSNLDWEDPDDTPEAFKKDLKIIYRTKSFPRAVELLRKDLDPKLKKRIKQILLKMHEDPAATDVLKAYSKTNRFDEFEGEAKKGLGEVRRMLEHVQEELR